MTDVEIENECHKMFSVVYKWAIEKEYAELFYWPVVFDLIKWNFISLDMSRQDEIIEFLKKVLIKKSMRKLLGGSL